MTTSVEPSKSFNYNGPNQGAAQRSLGTDGNGATVTSLFDYGRACDLIDHGILVRKFCKQCKLPPRILNRIIHFFFIGQIPAD